MMTDQWKPAKQKEEWHVIEGDVITAGPTPIRVVAVYNKNGTPLARCVIGNAACHPVTVTCQSLARYVESNGKSDLVMTEKAKIAA
jgi:hypothetical protein